MKTLMAAERCRGGLLLVLAVVGCSDPAAPVPDASVDLVADMAPFDLPPTVDVRLVDAPTVDASIVDLQPPDATAKTTFVAVTFNTGTTADTSPQAQISDQYYGNGLAWKTAVATTKAWLAQVDPDVAAFQEIFYAGDCPPIPPAAQQGYVCETWTPQDPMTVALMILGPGWQVACNPINFDKCLAVNTRFGTFQGCTTAYCPTAAVGFKVDGCGKGPRVTRAVVDLVGGGTLTLVGVHGTSGITSDDMDCRAKQVKQVFVDLGDGMPAANGTTNLVLGDLNTDPGRLALLDKSAAAWNKYVGPGKAYHFITDVGPLVPPTYSGLFNIDHVMSDLLGGSCWTAGVTPGHPPVIPTPYFDHKPAVCTLNVPKP